MSNRLDLALNSAKIEKLEARCRELIEALENVIPGAEGNHSRAKTCDCDRCTKIADANVALDAAREEPDREPQLQLLRLGHGTNATTKAACPCCAVSHEMGDYQTQLEPSVELDYEVYSAICPACLEVFVVKREVD